jgi:aryl carrier-like protein
MAPGNKNTLPVPVNFLCTHCKDEKDTGTYHQHTQTTSTSQELVNLQEDMLELNQILTVVQRCSVRDAIMAEINLISAKIDSLQAIQLHIQLRSRSGQRWSQERRKLHLRNIVTPTIYQ